MPYDGIMDLSIFTNRFEAHAQEYNWNLIAQASKISLFLKGKAAEVYDKLPQVDRCSIKKVQATFATHFQPSENEWLTRLESGFCLYQINRLIIKVAVPTYLSYPLNQDQLNFKSIGLITKSLLYIAYKWLKHGFLPHRIKREFRFKYNIDKIKNLFYRKLITFKW